MKAKLMLAACATALVPLAAAHPHPGQDDVSHEPYVAPELARAFESAWKLSLESTQAEGLILRADAERDAASSLLAAPPALELDHRESRGSGSSTARESEAAVVLPLWMPGQRRARGAAGDAEAAWAEASLHAARLRVAGEVRDAAWQLLAVASEEAAARVHMESLGRLADDVDRRVRAGDLPRADAMAARAEMLAAHSSRSEAESRVDAARSRWALLTGLPTIFDASEPEPTASAVENATLVHARSATVRAQRQLDHARASRREPIELSLKLFRESAEVNLPARNGGGIALRIPFGTAIRNAPRDAQAVAALDNARAEEQLVARRLEAEVRTARAAVGVARQRLEAEQMRSSLLRERGQLIEKSFHAGETPLPELLRARSAASQAESALARQQAELGLSRARLLQSLGVMP